MGDARLRPPQPLVTPRRQLIGRSTIAPATGGSAEKDPPTQHNYRRASMAGIPSKQPGHHYNQTPNIPRLTVDGSASLRQTFRAASVWRPINRMDWMPPASSSAPTAAAPASLLPPSASCSSFPVDFSEVMMSSAIQRRKENRLVRVDEEQSAQPERSKSSLDPLAATLLGSSCDEDAAAASSSSSFSARRDDDEDLNQLDSMFTPTPQQQGPSNNFSRHRTPSSDYASGDNATTNSSAYGCFSGGVATTSIPASGGSSSKRRGVMCSNKQRTGSGGACEKSVESSGCSTTATRGFTKTGSRELNSLALMHETTDPVGSGAAAPDKTVVVHSDFAKRLLRVTQHNQLTSDRTVTTQTRIEVVGVATDGSEFSIFAVRHFEQVLWGRQMKVHKNILLAAQLAETEVPGSLNVPPDAFRMYQQTDKSQHVHAFLERVVPHLSLEVFDPKVTMFWWRCVATGLAVLLNRKTGRLLISRNPDKTLHSAVACVTKLLNFLQLHTANGESQKATFWEEDPEYPVESDITNNNARVLSSSEIKSLCRNWAETAAVSPEITSHVIPLGQARFLRYSVLTDFRSPESLVVQVHLNEPLSRGSHAFPVCFVSLEPEGRTYADVRLCFLRAVFFLRKLMDVHRASLGDTNDKQATTTAIIPSNYNSQERQSENCEQGSSSRGSVSRRDNQPPSRVPQTARRNGEPRSFDRATARHH